MYWQVYLHKTVLSAEKMLVMIIHRARKLLETGKTLVSTAPALDVFLKKTIISFDTKNLELFCALDDYDVMSTIKKWMDEDDIVLSTLCRLLVNRNLLKVEFSVEKPEEGRIEKLKNAVVQKLGISHEEAEYLVFSGEAVNTTYNPWDERINILFRDGSVKDISKVDNALIHQTLASPIKKFYICFMA